LNILNGRAAAKLHNHFETSGARSRLVFGDSAAETGDTFLHGCGIGDKR
jgi:hypothetical protein